MRSGFLGHLAIFAAGLALTGCVQATRHSNTMVFGTNTTFGIKAGTTTGEVPEIVIGYHRQEAVIMPLVANTVSSEDPNLLSPCDLTTPVTVTGNAQFAVHPCSLVATNQKSQDSYSVLASFGASYDVNGTGAKGGLAQYFATGVAAQILAAKGGAALVATGEAAKASAATDATDSIAALITGNPAFARGEKDGIAARSIADTIDAKIRSTSQANLGARLADFDRVLGIDSGAPALCAGLTPEACANRVKSRDQYADTLLDGKIRTKAIEVALPAWTTP